MKRVNNQRTMLRAVCHAGLIGMLGLGSLSAAGGSAAFVHEGRAGFVISHIEYGLALEREDILNRACPNGMALNTREIFELSAEGKRRPGESDEEYQRRLGAGQRTLSTNADGKNVCMHPELWEPDPHHRSVTGSDVPVYGIALGGSQTFGADPALRFPSAEGNGAVENQFYRTVGCMRGFQPLGQFNGFATGMLTGSWGIVISLSDVDDIRNDDHVEVGIYANNDPIQLSASREPLAFATYAIKGDSRYHATTIGRIEGGVLITEPVDIRFLSETNQMYMERPLRDARLRLTVSEEGVLEGYMAGYTPIEDMYDFQFGFRSAFPPEGGELRRGQPQGSANGAASARGNTCHGVYHALYEHADGHPDPETGRFTSISTQYKIEAIPAFIVDMEVVRAERAQ